MRLTKIGPGHYEATTPGGTRLVIYQASATHNRYGQRRKHPRAGMPWRVRDTARDTVVAEAWSFAEVKDDARRYAERIG